MATTKMMKNDKMRVGVIGATSFIAEYLFQLLNETEADIIAFSRSQLSSQRSNEKEKITWRFPQVNGLSEEQNIKQWICLAPIWTLPQHFPLFLFYQAKHIVAISSTSRFTKALSSDKEEKKMAKIIADNEETLIKWAGGNNITWTILRPTLVYALGHDKNISIICKFIKKFSFFPLVGEGKGLRQPVHACDVALACINALNAEKTLNQDYNISGGESLTYRQMVEKVFESVGKKSRFVVLPLWIFRAAIFFLRVLPRFRHWSAGMAERMNQNLIFDHQKATNDFDFAPRKFILDKEDISVKSPM